MRIIIIPDTQVRKGVPLDHLTAAGKYIVDHRPDVVVHLGDHFDMPSLSKFNSKLEEEGLRIKEDIRYGMKGMKMLLKPLRDLQEKQKKNKKKVYSPRLVYLNGNHDPSVRIPRLYEDFPILKGIIKEPDLTKLGWETHPFLSIVNIGGIRFSHYFVNPHSAKKSPLGGMVDTMLKNCGFSFVQGHQQGLKMGKHYLSDGEIRLGIVAGSFYQHEEKYMGPQGNKHWQGIIMLNEVGNGSADICEVSLNYLLRKYK